jgi:hypothetical protein
VLVAQAVTDARLGRKELRSSRIVFDLAPEVAHVYAQIFNLFGVITPPDFLEDLALREYAAQVLGEECKQSVLDGGQVNLAIVEGHLVSREIDPQLPDFDERRTRWRRRAAQCGAYPREQFAHSEGFGEVIVSSRV